MLEARLAELKVQEQENGCDYVRLSELMEQRQELEAQLEQKTERWVYLNELAEKIQAQKNTQ